MEYIYSPFKINITSALDGCLRDVLVMGDLDPVSCLKQASSPEVEQITMKLLEEAEKYPNFVLSSGCDISPRVSSENIAVFIVL